YLVSFFLFFFMFRPPPRSTLFPYTTLSDLRDVAVVIAPIDRIGAKVIADAGTWPITFVHIPCPAAIVATAMRGEGILEPTPVFTVGRLRLRDISPCWLRAVRARVIRVIYQLRITAFSSARVGRHSAARERLALSQVIPQLMDWRFAFAFRGWPTWVRQAQ